MTANKENLFEMCRKIPKEVLHHDDPPCNARLINGWCDKCGVYPDTQSTCIYYYCPDCNERLHDSKCPKCKKSFEKSKCKKSYEKSKKTLRIEDTHSFSFPIRKKVMQVAERLNTLSIERIKNLTLREAKKLIEIIESLENLLDERPSVKHVDFRCLKCGAMNKYMVEND